MVVVALGITGCAAPRQAGYSYTEDGRLRMGNTPGVAVAETMLKNCVPATDIGPSYKKGRTPGYPRSLMRKGLTGYVIFEFGVTETGEVSNLKILKADHPEFAQETKRAVAQWRFKPAMQEGSPIAVVCTQKANFDLQE
jgi:TonB family protein